MQKRAFIVCGPESSGNRILGAVLCRAGCWGSGSTMQPKSVDEVPDEPLVMAIWHHNLQTYYSELLKRDFVVQAIMPVREWFANIGSLLNRKFDVDVATAEKRILKTIAVNLFDALIYDIPMIVTTYEGMTKESLVNLLSHLGLRHDNLDELLQLPGQDVPGQTYQPNGMQENLKHYSHANKQKGLGGVQRL